LQELGAWYWRLSAGLPESGDSRNKHRGIDHASRPFFLEVGQ
jgi:hypothetical protein